MVQNKPIGVFDSGIGGLTGVKELHRLLPNEDIYYFGDTARVPYGTHSVETIVRFARQDLSFLLSKDVKCILVACGTVSSNALQELREISPVPVIGVIHAASETAVNSSRNGRIGVFATQATIGGHAFTNEIKSIAPQCTVYEEACPLFVPLVENGYIDKNNTIVRDVVKEYVSRMLPNDIDTLILGCTHYPLLKDAIQSFMPGVTIIEAGKEAASELARFLQSKQMLACRDTAGTQQFFVSEITNGFVSSFQLFLGESVDRIEKVGLDLLNSYK